MARQTLSTTKKYEVQSKVGEEWECVLKTLSIDHALNTAKDLHYQDTTVERRIVRIRTTVDVVGTFKPTNT